MPEVLLTNCAGVRSAYTPLKGSTSPTGWLMMKVEAGSSSSAIRVMTAGTLLVEASITTVSSV